jgi:hypothetical protein
MSTSSAVINIGDHEYSGFPNFVNILSYWTALFESGHLPGEKDFARFAHLMPFTMFFEVVDGGTDFRLRDIGSCVSRFISQNQNGKLFSQYPNRSVSQMFLSLLGDCANSAQPVCYSSNMVQNGSEKGRFGRLFLPLSDDGRNVTVILALIEIGQHATGPYDPYAMPRDNAAINENSHIQR